MNGICVTIPSGRMRNASTPSYADTDSIPVCAVLSANTILGFIAGLIGRFLPKKWWIEWLCKIPGLGGGLLYLYFAGYYIMDKEANLFLAAVIALVPLAINLIAKIVTKASLMED